MQNLKVYCCIVFSEVAVQPEDLFLSKCYEEQDENLDLLYQVSKLDI